MLIELKGKSYKITISDTTTGIQFIGIRNSVVELSVHHQVPRQELMAYLQANHARLQREAKKTDSPDTVWIEIPLFDKKHFIQEDSKTKKPFLKGNTIYSPSLPKTDKQLEQLKASILRDQILDIIGLWEERLDFLLDNILIKALRSTDYRAMTDKNSITYSKRLSDLNPDMLAYIVATSVFDYLKLIPEQREPLYDKYVKDWKYLMKVYVYEKKK